MTRQKKPLLTSVDAAVANGVGTAINVAEYRNIGIQLAIPAGSTLTLKVMASNSEDAPDFSAAQSVTNHFDYAQVIDLEDGSAIDGDTGIVVAAGTEFRNLTVNADNFKWLSFEVSGYSAGSVTVKVRPVDNS